MFPVTYLQVFPAFVFVTLTGMLYLPHCLVLINVCEIDFTVLLPPRIPLSHFVCYQTDHLCLINLYFVSLMLIF